MRWLVAAALVALPLSVRAESAPAGTWKGILGNKLHVVVTLLRNERAGWAGVLEVTEQRSVLPLDKITIDGANLHFEVPKVTGVWDGTFSATQLAGHWTQAHDEGRPLSFELVDAPKPVAATGQYVDVPLEMTIRSAPRVLHAQGKQLLVYELHLVSYAKDELRLDEVEVLEGERVVSTLGRPELMASVGHAVETDPGPAHLRIAPGEHAVVYLWVPVERVPAHLVHRVSVSLGRDKLVLRGAATAVSASAPMAIGPPVRGDGWLASGAPSNASTNRRAMEVVGGRTHDARRFAIDWLRVGADGRTFLGAPDKNDSYLAYKQSAVAVASGTVVALVDELADNVPGPAPKTTLATALGNHVIVELARGHYALYAHLSPGSFTVKVGDKVKRGQVLALIGSSGSSTQPHLHFQLCDAPSGFACDGIPYVLEGFTTHGSAMPRKGEMPLEDEVVDLP